MSTKSDCYVWDFTLGEEFSSREDLENWCNEWCKKWTFQLEKGLSTGWVHYQGRVSLIKSTRNMKGKYLKEVRWSATSDKCKDDVEYVSKDSTKVDGPWANSDVKIPRQVREIAELYPWQKSVVADKGVWNTRNINLIYCEKGNIGKSILVGYMRAMKLARVVPSVNDAKDLLRMVYAMPTSDMYLFDMPRSMNKDKLAGFYSGLETIKDGYAYDDRYSFKEKIFDCPNIWVFTNILPNSRFLSEDRWRIWHVVDRCLVRNEVKEPA